MGTSASFQMVSRTLEFLSSFNVRPASSLSVTGTQDSFADEAGEWTLISRRGGGNGALLELWWENQHSSEVQTTMSQNFLSGVQGVKYPFEAQEARWDFSRDAVVGKGLISH